jgi:CRP-like cAMP-binding protein
LKLKPGQTLCKSGEKPIGVWFVLSGSLLICEQIKDNIPIVINEVGVGQSCGDPELNLTVSLTSNLHVSSS